LSLYKRQLPISTWYLVSSRRFHGGFRRGNRLFRSRAWCSPRPVMFGYRVYPLFLLLCSSCCVRSFLFFKKSTQLEHRAMHVPTTCMQAGSYGPATSRSRIGVRVCCGLIPQQTCVQLATSLRVSRTRTCGACATTDEVSCRCTLSLCLITRHGCWYFRWSTRNTPL
jgi:hypothetical protein